MPKQVPEVRRGNFSEVALGYSEEEAREEASRCLQCKKPRCVDGCPVEIDIPAFISLIAEDDLEGAAQKVKEKNSLPAICGRVCPQEEQCEAECVLGVRGDPVNIGGLERFVADWERKTGAEAEPERGDAGPAVAVVGSGPAGLTCAADLARAGCQVTLFEALHSAGGVLRYGIPEFRLPKDILEHEVRYVRSLGVDLQPNVVIGKTIRLEDLFEKGYRAVFLGTGAGLPYFLNIEGENLNGVYSANEFLVRVNLMKAYRAPQYDTPVRIGSHVAVVGAGNVAMDSARTALRLGAEEVSIVYRRSEEEMPARLDEIENARQEGVIFRLLTNPTRLEGEDGWVKSMRCIRMELGDEDESGRRRPVPIEGSEFTMDVDTVVVAIGQGPNPLLAESAGELETTADGRIVTDETILATSMGGVFAGGDIVTGAATVIAAMGAGKRAARSILEYLKNGA